jgi:hypothetical protein
VVFLLSYKKWEDIKIYITYKRYPQHLEYEDEENEKKINDVWLSQKKISKIASLMLQQINKKSDLSVSTQQR